MVKVICLDTDGEIQEIDQFTFLTPKKAVLLALQFRYPFAVIIQDESTGENP